MQCPCVQVREKTKEKVHAVEGWFAHCDIYTVLQHDAVMPSQNTECIKMSDSTCHVEN